MHVSIILSLFFLLVSCSKSPTQFKGIAHTHPYHVQLDSALSPTKKKEVQGLLTDIFETVDALYNHWNPKSMIAKNPTSPTLLPILTLAHHYKKITQGRFDPGLGVQLKLFKTLSKLPKGFYPKVYDLDGMLKGFTIDRIIEKLTEKGYKHMYVEWGGDIRVQGKHPSNRNWKILIGKEVIELEEGALATSGCQEQLWDIENTTYTHIMNPLTGNMLKVENGVVHKVTVQAPTCALADALATATMACESFAEASAFADAMKKEYNVDFWIETWDIKR